MDTLDPAPARRSAAPPRAGRDASSERSGLGALAAVAGVVLLLGVLPLVSTPETLDVREPVRRVVITLALAAGVVTWWADREDPHLPRAVWWAMGVVALTVAAATAASDATWLSVVGRFPRDEGLLMILAYLAMLPAGALLLRRPMVRRVAVWSATLSGWVLVSMGLRDALGGAYRVVTALGNASTVGIWGLMLATWLGWIAWRERSWVALAGAVAGGLLVILGASRGAMLGLFCAGALALVVVARTEGVRRTLVPAGVVLGSAVLVLLLPITRDRIFMEQEGAGTNITVRLMMWRHTARMIAESPLLGVGPSRWVAESAGGYGPEWEAVAAPGVRLDGVHNVVLQTAVAIGLVGLAAVTLLAAVVAHVLLRTALRPVGEHREGRARLGPQSSWSPAALCVGVGMAAALMFAYTEPVFVVPGAFIVGGGLSAAHAASAGGTTPRDAAVPWRSRRWRPLAHLVVTGVVAVMVVGTLLDWAAYRQARFAVVSQSPVVGAQHAQRAADLAPWDPNVGARTGFALTNLAAGRTPWNPSYGPAPVPQATLLSASCPQLGADQVCLASQAIALSQAGRPVEGVRLANRAVDLGPESHRARVAQHQVLLAAGRPDLAVAAATEHVQRNPHVFTAWRMLAASQQASGDLPAAQQSMVRADEELAAFRDR